jgi:hypothetical protein
VQVLKFPPPSKSMVAQSFLRGGALPIATAPAGHAFGLTRLHGAGALVIGR